MITKRLLIIDVYMFSVAKKPLAMNVAAFNVCGLNCRKRTLITRSLKEKLKLQRTAKILQQPKWKR